MLIKRWSTLKIGKKLCFPDVPSTWVPRTVESIMYRQDCYSRAPNLKDPNGIIPPPPKNNDYEADESSCCNPLSLFPPTPTPFSLAYKHVYTPIQYTDHYLGTKDAFVWSSKNSIALSDFFETDDMPENRYTRLNKGDTFDVISLLKTYSDYLVRNNGDTVQVDSLRGNNILVFCVFVPCFWLHNYSNALRTLITFCARQNNKAEVNTEMVVVPKMRRNWATSDDADHVFNHFFSGFPPSCLAVPFSHTQRRHHICNSLGLVSDPRGLLVDSTQKVVLHEDCYQSSDVYCFYNLLSDAYLDLCEKHTHLDLILDLNSHYVFKTTNNNNDNKTVPLSELKQKIVGLYLCFDGSFIRTLDMIYQECTARNQEFEVVLVYLPYQDGVNPSLFQEAINHVLKNFNISNWWVSPFDDFVSRRLWEAVGFSQEDELVILDPHTNNADPFAKSVLHWFGINSYPFTRESLVRRELKALKAVTLESLLVYGSRDHVLRIDKDNNVEEVPVAQLRGKTVILYVDRAEDLWSEVYPKLLDWYNQIKASTAADNFEVVFVSDTPFVSPKLQPMPIPMPWLVCPFDLDQTDLISWKTLHSGRYSYLVAFGQDGHIIKIRGVIDLLHKCGPDGFPPCSNDYLCKDIIFTFWHNYNIDMADVFV